MPMKTKAITTKSEQTASNEIHRPINAFIMLEPVSHLLELLGTKSKFAIDINLLIIEYDKKCSQAKIDLDNEILKLMKKTK
jgi:hypothetical protein